MDEDDNIVRVLSYIYTGDGQLYSVHDSATGYTYIYTYDPLGRLIASRVEDANSETLMRTKLWYNASNQITKQSWTIGDSTYEETYTYNTGDATLSAYQNALGQTISLSYDSLRRLSTITAGNIYTKSYTYRDIDSTKTTTQVSSLSYSGFTDAPSFGYTYDELGNIATYTENGTVYTYTYDDLNQLLTATGGGKTYAYTYDLGGNILTASNGTTSHTYTYGDSQWADLLTAYDGQAITYDGSGNPLSYYNGNRYTFTWEEGRRLATASGNGHNVSYTYDLNGLRLSQTVDGTKTYSYAYIGDRLSEMTIAENGTVRRLSFVYDSTGPYAVTVTNGSSSTTYYYVLNLQGDVVAIVNSAGTAVVEYTYDPWGKLLSIDGAYKNGLGIRNPLRYRGYVYDTETQLYYLQSRYYDAEIGRFLNADAYASTGQGILGHNTFAYCLNNPLNRQDTNGKLSELFGIPSLVDFYHMHKAVQYDIVETYGYGMEVRVVGPGGRHGYLDIYDLETNSYYEIKSSLAASTSACEKQMEFYDESHVSGWRFFEYQIDGDVKRNTKRIKGTTQYKFWDIFYHTKEDGLIVYTYSINEERYNEYLMTVSMVAVYCAGSYALKYSGAGQYMEREILDAT